MIYAVNMVDCMLVLAVGFLIFSVMSMNIQSVVFSDMTFQEKTQVSQIIKQTVQIQMGQQLNNTPQIQNNNGSGYSEMGKVYKDTTTGKLIMIPGG
ncbi:DUF2149 domain-containing protein [Methanobacterium sp. SMA-27]|uniref:DUF2149 domain-containing protein n=1 Tax=Methanobacterium sp. SMA-27 TaxID=1495336 RepID=UPI00064E3BAE|nr:DUF2149 domain-containing protein [Methanobacterium sp. SMA-27]